MSPDQKDESQQRHAEPGQPIDEVSKTVEGNPEKVPVQPPDAPRPKDRPDLDWVEHED